MTAAAASAGGRLPERLAGPVLELLTEAGRRPRIRMRGQSMRPFIEPGDELVIEPGPESFRLGDVVLYRHDGRSIVHRVVGWRRSGLERLVVVKGDRALGFDPPIAEERIFGRVVERLDATGSTDYRSSSWRILNRLAALLSAAAGIGYETCHALRRQGRRWSRSRGDR